MARPNKIINIGISWTGFLLAVLVSLAVVLTLLWIKRNHSTETFQEEGKSVSYKLLSNKPWLGARVATSICKSAEPESEKKKSKIDKKFPRIPCGAIMDRNNKPRPTQVALAMLLIARKFVNIFNYNGDPIASNNTQYRNDFIDIIVAQCNASGEPSEDIGRELRGIQQLTVNKALELMNKYDCVLRNCESMVRRIRIANAGTIQAIKEKSYSVVKSGSSANEQASVSMEPGVMENDYTTTTTTTPNVQLVDNTVFASDAINNSFILDPDFDDLDSKMAEIIFSNCPSTEGCIMGAAADADPEFNAAMDALANSYSPALVVEMLKIDNEIYSDPKNKATINEPMVPLPQSERVASSTSAFSCDDFTRSFS